MAKKGKLKFDLKDRDRGMRDILAIGKMKHGLVKVGVLGNGKGLESREGGLTNVELAALHEFGSPEQNIPERSFIRASVEKHRDEYMELLAGFLKKAITDAKNMSIDKALGMVGAKAAADVKKFVADGFVRPQNSPATQVAKFRRGLQQLSGGREGPVGPPRALIDSGRMIGAVTWQVISGLGAPKKGKR